MVRPGVSPHRTIEFGPIGGIHAVAFDEDHGWLMAYHWHRPAAWDDAIGWAYKLGLEPLDDLPLLTLRTLDLYELGVVPTERDVSDN